MSQTQDDEDDSDFVFKTEKSRMDRFSISKSGNRSNSDTSKSEFELKIAGKRPVQRKKEKSTDIDSGNSVETENLSHLKKKRIKEHKNNETSDSESELNTNILPVKRNSFLKSFLRRRKIVQDSNSDTSESEVDTKGEESSSTKGKNEIPKSNVSHFKRIKIQQSSNSDTSESEVDTKGEESSSTKGKTEIPKNDVSHFKRIKIQQGSNSDTSESEVDTKGEESSSTKGKNEIPKSNVSHLKRTKIQQGSNSDTSESKVDTKGEESSSTKGKNEIPKSNVSHFKRIKIQQSSNSDTSESEVDTKGEESSSTKGKNEIPKNDVSHFKRIKIEQGSNSDTSESEVNTKGEESSSSKGKNDVSHFKRIEKEPSSNSDTSESEVYSKGEESSSSKGKNEIPKNDVSHLKRTKIQQGSNSDTSESELDTTSEESSSSKGINEIPKKYNNPDTVHNEKILPNLEQEREVNESDDGSECDSDLENKYDSDNDTSVLMNFSSRMKYEPTCEEKQKLMNMVIELPYPILPQHKVERTAGTRALKSYEKKEFQQFAHIHSGKYKKPEDRAIRRNWKSFCQMYNWDEKNPKPFLQMRYQNKVVYMNLRNRKKFIQFMAKGLVNRTLYSVFNRFKVLFNPHKKSRYNDKEDEIILDFIKKYKVGVKDRKFADLSIILKRTRASVWRRYRILKRKRDLLHNSIDAT